MMTPLEKAEACHILDRADLIALLSLPAGDASDRLFAAARKRRDELLGNKVYFRGLVELSNVCVKNCYYCGIRRDNHNVRRYTMSEEEIVSGAVKAWKMGLGSAVLQSGERSDPAFVSMIERVLHCIIAETGGELGITLSLGEQTEETYRLWRKAGARRYLLRIEEADPQLYAQLHPVDHSWSARRECLRLLQKCGYQTGTGVMCGLPGQTVGHLADDLLFMKAFDTDMIGMGPYLPNPDTPLASRFPDFEEKRSDLLFLGLKMIACARLLMPDVNIASTTALQTLCPDGRELGLMAGANVIMPNMGDGSRKKEYSLYTGKSDLDDTPETVLARLTAAVRSTGCEIALRESGDPRHFFARAGRQSGRPHSA